MACALRAVLCAACVHSLYPLGLCGPLPARPPMHMCDQATLRQQLASTTPYVVAQVGAGAGGGADAAAGVGAAPKLGKGVPKSGVKARKGAK